jgi:hypothetical protein
LAICLSLAARAAVLPDPAKISWVGLVKGADPPSGVKIKRG